ncbi:hypothetical protein SSX86_031334 [Deinandra increscens subsp. villosa]|uniref:DUF4371 domain-containing protein n=1 Tax=Deinandra increscens subsp. villosa TaxID=3103831 RepID=A0AAP0C954_9ASTR
MDGALGWKSQSVVLFLAGQKSRERAEVQKWCVFVWKCYGCHSHDDSEDSLYRGHFLEILKLLGEINESFGNIILGNAPKNNQMTSPPIQKDICNCFAQEELKHIFEELGAVKERFIGLVHVMKTSALSLKYDVDELFAMYNLSLSNVRGQGYDGASNMAAMQIQEFGNRFNEVTTELLICMASLSPHNKFHDFDILKLLKLDEKYPNDFDFDAKDKLKYELDNYITNMKDDTRFLNINDISNLAKIWWKQGNTLIIHWFIIC